MSLFSRVVQQCVEAGLVEGRKIHVDAFSNFPNYCSTALGKISGNFVSNIRPSIGKYRAAAKLNLKPLVASGLNLNHVSKTGLNDFGE